MVAVEKARKRQLEEELAEAEQKELSERASSPAPKAKETASKESVHGELTRVATEVAREEKIEEAREKKEQIVTPKESLSAEKPELGSTLDEQAAVARSRQHQTIEEVFRDQSDLQSKAAELRERDLDERVRAEKLAGEQKLFTERFQGGKKAPALPERKRIRRPPTSEERLAEEQKAHQLEVLHRKEQIRKKLDAQEAAKRKVVGRIEWLQARLSAVLSRIKTIFRLK